MAESANQTNNIKTSDPFSKDIRITNQISSYNQEQLSKWVDNNGNEVKQVFGFNANAELVNGRAAMFGFIMLILTELAFGSEPVTRSLFGIG